MVIRCVCDLGFSWGVVCIGHYSEYMAPNLRGCDSLLVRSAVRWGRNPYSFGVDRETTH